MASRAKPEFADAVGALSTWHQYAPLKAVVTDWGAPYIKHRFRAAVEDVGATKEFPPAGWPAHRAFIERWFGTAASQLASRMHAKVFSNVVLRADYPSEALAWLTSDEAAYVLVRYVVDAYHNSPHEGLSGETPYECYERIILERGIDAPIGPHRRRVCFGQSHNIVPSNRGARFLGNFYSCPELAQA